jgi:hypothetical protein
MKEPTVYEQEYAEAQVKIKSSLAKPQSPQRTANSQFDPLSLLSLRLGVSLRSAYF